jgi:hypothetical protein
LLLIFNETMFYNNTISKKISFYVNFGFLNLFLDIWIQNPDPDSEYVSRIQAQFECGSNRIRIRNTAQERSFSFWNYISS